MIFFSTYLWTMSTDEFSVTQGLMWPLINKRAGDWFPAKYVQGGGNNLRGLYAYKVFVGMLCRSLFYQSSALSFLSAPEKVSQRQRLAADRKDVSREATSLYITKARLRSSAFSCIAPLSAAWPVSHGFHMLLLYCVLSCQLHEVKLWASSLTTSAVTAAELQYDLNSSPASCVA